jgi:hypothetical protein
MKEAIIDLTSLILMCGLMIIMFFLLPACSEHPDAQVEPVTHHLPSEH